VKVSAAARKAYRARTNTSFTPTASPAGGWLRLAVRAEITADRKVLRNLCMHLEAIRDECRSRYRLPVRSQLQRQTEGIEDPRAIAEMDVSGRDQPSTPRRSATSAARARIRSVLRDAQACEFLPYFRKTAMDVAIIDTPERVRNP
jgi:hypothetical protein